MYPTEEQIEQYKAVEKYKMEQGEKTPRWLIVLAIGLVLVCVFAYAFAIGSRPGYTFPTPTPRPHVIGDLPAATQTPIPTPFPTATAAPTWTAAPSSTPLPTWTAIPAVPAIAATAAPLPTLTPLPTHTAAPTYTPPPTYTAQPTSALVPTEPIPTHAPVAPTDPAEDRIANAALIALAGTALLFAVVAVFIGLLAIMTRPPAVQPAPIVINSQAAPNPGAAAAPVDNQGTPLPQARPLRLRQRPANEQRVRVSETTTGRVEPVESVELAEPKNRVQEEPITDGGVGEAEVMMISLPFDSSRAPTAEERAYIRLRYRELQSKPAVCKDVYGSQGGKTYGYVKAAVEEGDQPITSASQVIIQRRIEL